mgnify:CR=1 FL=1
MLSFLFSKTPLFFFAQSLWRDEAFSYFLAKKNIFEIIFLTAKDFNPPLYYLLLHFWIKIFGSSEIAIRSLSLVFYWATIYVVFLLLTEILKVKEKFILTLFLITFALNPLFLYYAFEARNYTLFSFLSFWSSYAFLKEDKKKYIIASFLGLFTHYFMIFVFLSQILTYLIFKKKFKKIKLNYFFYLASFLILWFFFVFIQNEKIIGDRFWIKKPDFFMIKNLFGILFTGFEKDFGFSYKKMGFLSLFITFLIIYGFFIKKNTQKPIFFYLFFNGVFIPLFVIIVSYFKPIFLPRYLISSSLLMLIFLFFLINQIKTKKITVFIIFILLFFSFDYQKLQIKFRKKSNYKKLYQEIKALAKKDDFVYVVSELDYFVAGYYFDINRVKIFNKNYEQIPNYVGKVLIPKKAITFSFPSYPQKAFIVENNSYSIQAVF